MKVVGSHGTLYATWMTIQAPVTPIPPLSPGHYVVQVMPIGKHLRHPHVEACHVGCPNTKGDDQEKKEEEATTPPHQNGFIFHNGLFRG